MTKRTRMHWLLLLSLGLLTVVVMLLLYDWLIRPTSSPPAVGLAVSGVTAQESFDPAIKLAAQWQKDAHLAAVSGQWSKVGLQQRDEIEWAFQFFSPSTQRMALVTVTGETARLVRESLSPYKMSTFSIKEWRVDSDQALQTWWASGGSTLVKQRPDTTLVMQLRISEGDDDAPVWMMSGFVSGMENALTVMVNASDGALVEP